MKLIVCENADKLGLSLADVDYAVLSHAHYDHADGMSVFLDRNSRAKLWLQESCRENCYRVKEGRMKYIGIRKGLLEKYRDRLVCVRGDQELDEGIRLIAHHTPQLEKAGRKRAQTDCAGENMRITVLTDNIGRDGLTGEWGLSFYIEYHGRKLILDAGQSGIFAENAECLKNIRFYFNHDLTDNIILRGMPAATKRVTCGCHKKVKPTKIKLR